MSDEKQVEKVEAAAAAKKEDKKAAVAAPAVKKEEAKSADCQCQEKLDKLIAALIQSHPAVAKQIIKSGLGE
jgi:hypothetical protein